MTAHDNHLLLASLNFIDPLHNLQVLLVQVMLSIHNRIA